MSKYDVISSVKRPYQEIPLQKSGVKALAHMAEASELQQKLRDQCLGCQSSFLIPILKSAASNISLFRSMQAFFSVPMNQVTDARRPFLNCMIGHVPVSPSLSALT
jgi:hypothetical protein